jgi:hypothetical protein
MTGKQMPSIKFGTGTKVRFKILDVSQEDPNQIRMWEGRFAGILVDPKFAPIPMYSFLMEEDTENEYIKLVPVQAVLYIDIMEMEKFTPEDSKELKDRLEGDKGIYG